MEVLNSMGIDSDITEDGAVDYADYKGAPRGYNSRGLYT